MNFRYQVRVDGMKCGTIYGIYQKYDDEAKAAAAQGKAVVEDAVLPKRYIVPESALVDIRMEPGNYDPDTEEFVAGDEYQSYVQSEFKKAQAISAALPGFGVGSLFSIGVADGYAYYVVTKVNRKTCRVEWRGFCPDRYVDHWLGHGGTFPLEKIATYVEHERARARLFGRQA